MEQEQQAHLGAHRRPRWPGWLLAGCSLPKAGWVAMQRHWHIMQSQGSD